MLERDSDNYGEMISKKITRTNPLVYNITLKIAEEYAEEWFLFMKEEVLPVVTDGHIIVSSQVNKLLIKEEEEDITYAIQFTFSTVDIYEDKGLQSLATFLRLLDSRYQGKYVYFTTKMEVIHYHMKASQN